MVPPFFLLLYSASIGLSSSATAGLVAAFNLSSAVGRIVSGLLGDRLGLRNTLFASVVLSGLSLLVIWPFSTSLGPLVVFAIVNVATAGGFFALMPTVAASVFGSARVAAVLSMLVVGWAGGYVMGSPIAGYLLAPYGGQERGLTAYRPAMYYAGALTMGSAIFVAIVRLRKSRKVTKVV